MNRQLLEQSRKLGNRPYQMMTFLDRTTDGEQVYVAMIPELPGCHTHGDSEEEALELLDEVKVEFIYFMLEDRLAIPEPKAFDTFTTINISDIEDSGASKRAAVNQRLSIGNSFSVTSATANQVDRRVYVA